MEEIYLALTVNLTRRYTDKYWTLNDTIIIKYDNVIYRIPKGFKTNLLYIPKWARWLIDPMGKGWVSAIVHDYHYSRGIKADELFYNMLLGEGVNKGLAYIMYKSVQIFGRPQY